MPALILVRHAAPVINPATPSATWELSAAGAIVAARLATLLAPFAPFRVINSPEPKAHATAMALAAPAGLAVAVDPDLREHSRRDAPYLHDSEVFLATISRLLREPDQLVYGDETGATARDRFAAGVARALAATPAGESLVVVSGGTVISLYLGVVAGLDPVAFWRKLGMPAYVVLHRPALTVTTIVNDVTAPPDGAAPPG